MTDTDTTTPAGEAAATVTERWTFGGYNAGAGKDRRAIWYDASRHAWYFTPVKGTHPVVGCDYEVEATRGVNPETDRETITRQTVPQFIGQAEDREWVAQLEASAHAVDLEVTAAAMERRAARGDSALDEAIAPLERLAAGMNYTQRSALADLVTRKIYRADRPRS